MLTRSADRALLTNRVTIDKLPEEVLLEIFDTYRQDMELQPGYETLWNSRNGWFKLAHVCRSWRRLVHSSPSRLHVHLLFTPRRSSRVAMLRCLPPFPILVNYHNTSWTEKVESLALAAIRHRSRVRGIDLVTPHANMPKLIRSLGHPFPELESLKINVPYYRDHDGVHELILTTLRSISAPRLRHLTLLGVIPRCLSPLSSTTGLVELTLTLGVAHNTLPEASLIADLQRMSCLRRLVLKLSYVNNTTIGDGRRSPADAGGIVPLPKLTQLHFDGHAIYLEALLVTLTAPSLQCLEARFNGGGDPFPIPHLCRFICDTVIQFNWVRLDFPCSRIKFAARTCPGSVHAKPFAITGLYDISVEELCNRLSGPLSTVEELVVGPFFTHRVQWCRFFDYIKQVKFVQVPPDVALDLAQFCQLDGQEPAMDRLPALEQVKVQSPLTIRSDDQYAPIRDAFQPIIAARKQMGRHIILSCEMRL